MSQTTISAVELEALIATALVASRTSQPNAASVARALAQAEIDGQAGHGLSRVPSYAAQARSGKVDGHATPVARQTRPGSLMIDAANGFAFPAFDLAISALPALATANGLAAAGIVRSHHAGVARPSCRTAGGGRAGGARVWQYAEGHGALGRQAAACTAPTRSPLPRRSADTPPIVSTWR